VGGVTPFFKWFLLGMVAVIVANTSDYVASAIIWNLVAIGFFITCIVAGTRK